MGAIGEPKREILVPTPDEATPRRVPEPEPVSAPDPASPAGPAPSEPRVPVPAGG